jgi:hypothetical protein
MRIAIMQPYFMPYIGYFQLISSVDEFIIYDNIQYTKKGWINRNRISVNGKDQFITIPIKKDSDYLDVSERMISDNWGKEKYKILNIIKSFYGKAPNFKEAYGVIEDCLNIEEENLFNFIYETILIINNFLDIKTKIIISSDIDIDHNLRSKNKVIEICKNRNAEIYVNSIGGISLYDKEEFKDNGIILNFIKSNPIKYQQSNSEFIPWLSIVDVMMFNSKEKIKEYLKEYTLV